MDSSQKDPQAIPPHLEQKSLIEFLESLHRICKIGTYYPAGHTVLDQAAEQFQRKLGVVADMNRSVLIELKGETLFVEATEIVTETNAVREFKRLLLDLGIGSVEIDRAILLKELLQFVRNMLLGRSQLQGVKQFTQADIVDLPSSVRIRQKEFLVDEGAILVDASGEDAVHGLNSVFQVLAEQGLERNQIEQCKNFLNSLSERFASQPLNIKGLPAVNWSDVRSLLVRVVNNAYHHPDGPGGAFVHNDLNALSAIFIGLERETQDRDAKETINLLVSVFGGAAFGNKQDLDAETAKLKGIRAADNIPVLSVGQLQSFVNENFVHNRILEKINQIDRREELAILLQLLPFKQEPAAEGKIRQSLRDILANPQGLGAKEVEILIRGVVDLVKCSDATRFHSAVLFLTSLMRSAKNFSSQQFLLLVCRQISPAMQTLIWPIVVNELLLIGRGVDQNLFTELMMIAVRVSTEEMKELWPALEAMDTFQEKKIATDIFDPDAKIAFPLFSFLFETSLKKHISARVLSSLMEKPPDWLLEAVAPLLQLTIPQHLKFLQAYLLVAPQKKFSLNMRVAAGTIVAHHLPEISEQQKNEAWVVKTILATPEIQVEQIRSVLERIVEEKRMVVIPKWPNACRRAATEALKNLKRKSLTSA